MSLRVSTIPICECDYTVGERRGEIPWWRAGYKPARTIRTIGLQTCADYRGDSADYCYRCVCACRRHVFVVNPRRSLGYFDVHKCVSERCLCYNVLYQAPLRGATLMRTAIPRVAPEVNHNIVPPALSLLPHISHFAIDGYVASSARPRPQANCPYSLHACVESIR